MVEMNACHKVYEIMGRIRTKSKDEHGGMNFNIPANEVQLWLQEIECACWLSEELD